MGIMLLSLHLVFTIFCIILFHSNRPMLGGDARVVLNACCNWNCRYLLVGFNGEISQQNEKGLLVSG